MAPWIVTAVCVVGLAAAAAVAVRSGGLAVVRRARANDETVAGWHGARRILRALAVSVASG